MGKASQNDEETKQQIVIKMFVLWFSPKAETCEPFFPRGYVFVWSHSDWKKNVHNFITCIDFCSTEYEWPYRNAFVGVCCHLMNDPLFSLLLFMCTKNRRRRRSLLFFVKCILCTLVIKLANQYIVHPWIYSRAQPLLWEALSIQNRTEYIGL